MCRSSCAGIVIVQVQVVAFWLNNTATQLSPLHVFVCKCLSEPIGCRSGACFAVYSVHTTVKVKFTFTFTSRRASEIKFLNFSMWSVPAAVSCRGGCVVVADLIILIQYEQ